MPPKVHAAAFPRRYDTLTAGVFERAGVRALLVGDTSAEMVLGYRDTLPVTMDELVSMVAGIPDEAHSYA